MSAARRPQHDLPAAAVEGAHGVRNWDAVASLPGLDVFATDPYWHVNQPARPFVERYARLLAESAAVPA